MSDGLQSFAIKANTSTPNSGGGNGSGLVAVINQSVTTQAQTLNLVDAPSYAAYNGNPSAWKQLFNTQEGAGQFLDCTFLNKPIRVDYGIVAIPAGTANSDGGWLVVFE